MEQRLRSRIHARYATDTIGLIDHARLPSGIYDFVIRHLPPRRDARIVELACGQGGLLHTLAARGYTNLSGIDASPQQVDYAHAAGLSMVRLGDYREALTEHDLDAVVAIDFLEHLTKPEVVEALELVRTALRPGGVLIMRSPNGSSMFPGHYLYDEFTHETAFTARSLNQLGKLTGYSSVEVYPSEPPTDTVKHTIAFVISRTVQAVVRTALRVQCGKRHPVVTLNLVGVLRK